MKTLRLLLLLFVIFLSGCTSLERTAHLYASDALPSQAFQYSDGGSGLYYTFRLQPQQDADTAVFFFAATGCASLKSVMPDYVKGLGSAAQVYALNKRFVADRSTGLLGCGDEFHLANHPQRWVSDYAEFITAQLKTAARPYRRVVVVGVSEAAITSTLVAAQLPQVTHLVIIGDGGYTMRRSLQTLKRKGSIGFDVDQGWADIAANPRSIDREWFGNPYRWWVDVMDLDLMPTFLKLDIPILVAMWDADESVPVESARFLESTFKQAGKHNLTLQIYPGADHRLSRGAVSLRDEFFASAGRWLRLTD